MKVLQFPDRRRAAVRRAIEEANQRTAERAINPPSMLDLMMAFGATSARVVRLPVHDQACGPDEDAGGACWTPCVCGNYWCRLHRQHAHDCPCPPVEDWATSPYLDGLQEPPIADPPEAP